jgi:hypothetical protein
MKRLLTAVLPLFLAACASAPPMRVDVPDIARSQGVAVRDERPATETHREAFSYLITSDAYGVLRNGELGLEPAPVRLLQHRAFEQGGAGSTVVVHHFVSYENMQSQLRAVALGAVLGPIGSAVGATVTANGVPVHVNNVDPAAFEALVGDNEWKRGTVSAAENPAKGASLITYLDAEFKGKRAFVRVVSPFVIDGRIAYPEAVDTAIRQWLLALDTAPVAIAAAPAKAAPAAVAPTAPAVVATATAAPGTLAAMVAAETKPSSDVLRHVDANGIDGKEWVFPSWNPQVYRDVHLVFRNGNVEAANQHDHTSGTYTVAGDKVCVDLRSKAWGKTCYVVIEPTTGDEAHGLLVMAVPNGDRLPLTIR